MFQDFLYIIETYLTHDFYFLLLQWIHLFEIIKVIQLVHMPVHRVLKNYDT